MVGRYLAMPGRYLCVVNPLLPSTILHPFCKLLPLLSDIHKAGPRVEGLERVADIALASLSARIQEPFLSFALDLACPHSPLDWAKGRGPQN